MIRVRHYTRVSSLAKILAANRIIARDQNRVFFERAGGRPLSPGDAEETYGILPGKGNAFVEFDIDDTLVGRKWNARTKRHELSTIGNVDLTDANPVGFENF